jgi:RNA polymerase sigma-70 factor (ECF subfamily)
VDAIMVCSTDQGDRELIAAAQMGERSALDELVRRHDRWVRNVVYATGTNPGAIDDIVQNVWIRVWQQIGTLIDPARWRAWLYKLAKNAAIDAGLKAASEHRSRMEFIRSGNRPAGPPRPAAALMEEEERRKVLAAIRGLPTIYREPFILRHLEGWSYAEIAEAMSLPVDTVETRLVRARRLLRTALQDLAAQQKAHA